MNDQYMVSSLARLLIRKNADYKLLETKILSYEILPMVSVYGDEIVGGLDEYEICTANNIPYRIYRLDFSTIYEAYRWICEVQLERNNLNKPVRTFLIGLICICQCAIENQLTVTPFADIPTNNSVVEQEAAKYGISVPAMYHYKYAASSVLIVYESCPNLVEAIFTEKLLISQESIINLSKRTPGEFKQLLYRIQESDEQVRYLDICREFGWQFRKKHIRTRLAADKEPEIRKMPRFDPDSELSSLSLTISSWIMSIKRLQSSGVGDSSRRARNELFNQLESLKRSAAELQKLMEANK